MKYVCLDIGNVLCHVDFEPIVTGLSRTLNVSQADVMYFLRRVQKLHDLGLTNLSDELRDHFKIRSETIVSDLIAMWNSCIRANADMLNSIYLLGKSQEIKIAILSNIGFEHKDNLKNILSQYHQELILDNAITHFSCDVGCRKPSLLYYQSFLQQYPEFKGAVYVDDLKENLASSEKFGFRTFHFDLTNYFLDSGATKRDKQAEFWSKNKELIQTITSEPVNIDV